MMSTRPEFWHSYVREISKYSQRETLVAIAKRSANSYRKRMDDIVNASPATDTGALAASFSSDGIARDVIIYGSRSATRAPREDDLDRLSSRYLNLRDPVLDRDAGHARLREYSVRVFYEQFFYQQFPYFELARSWAIFGETAEIVGARSMRMEAWEHSLGCGLDDFMRLVFAVNSMATVSDGWVDLRKLDIQVLKTIKFSADLSVANKASLSLSGTLDRIRTMGKNSRLESGFEKYRFNPLNVLPYVRQDSLLLAPSSDLASRRVWTSRLYFDRVADSGFTDELGGVFQFYVGRQLRTLENAGIARVSEEVFYRRNGTEFRSVDWIVEILDTILLVEAKSGRLTEEGRWGVGSHQSEVDRTLTAGYDQIYRTAAEIRLGSEEFLSFASNRRMIGFVVTLEPFWLFEDPRQEIPRQSDIEIHPLNSQELELFVQAALAGSAGKVLEVLSEHIDGVARRARNVLATVPRVANPILDSAYSNLFGN